LGAEGDAAGLAGRGVRARRGRLYLAGSRLGPGPDLPPLREGGLFQYADPLSLWRKALAHERRTKFAVCLAGWGLAAFLSAFVVLWRNDFAFKDVDELGKRVSLSVAGTAGGEQEEVDGFLDPDQVIVLGTGWGTT
jgi:hypothetical protein